MGKRLNFFFLSTALTGLIGLALPACQKTGSSGTIADTEAQQLTSAGRDIVQDQCLGCHSLDERMASPRPEAPALSQVLNMNNAESLIDDFREGIHVGDPDMPDFDFGPMGSDAVVAYLKSIQTLPQP